MRRHFFAVPGRGSVLLVTCLVWMLVRAGHDYVTWQRRETTLDSLAEGRYHVVRVIDWRDLLLSTDDKAQRARVRLIGISAPAIFTTDRPSDPAVSHNWQDQATNLTRDLVATGTVHLRLDRRRIDRSRVFLAYVFVGDHLLNEELVRAGLALVDVRPRDSSTMVRRLQRAQSEARDAGRGIWADSTRVATHAP